MKSKETLEKSAELFSKKRAELDPIYSIGLYYGYIEGAERQSEKMYSKEDLIQAFKDGENNMKCSEMDGWFRKLTFQKWFQQFKKK
jgi:hypothetical protein